MDFAKLSKKAIGFFDLIHYNDDLVVLIPAVSVELWEYCYSSLKHKNTTQWLTYH